MVRQYIWLGDMPVAVLDGSVNPANPTLYYVHADHLNRPEMMTDGAQSIVWQATYEPFGSVHQITGPAANDQRLPGQWFQLESGLAYNWHRHYDATTGRYTQADPLGDRVMPGSGPATTPVLDADMPGGSSLMASRKLGLASGLDGGSGGLTGTLMQLAAGHPVPPNRGAFAAPAYAVTAPRDGASLYGYARQSPVVMTDAMGLFVKGPMTIRGDRESIQCSFSDEYCRQARKTCQNYCTTQYELRMFSGPDAMRKCLRLCMEEHGCVM